MTWDDANDTSIHIRPLRVEEHAGAAAVIARAFRHEGFMQSTLELSTRKQRERLAVMVRMQLLLYHNAGHRVLGAMQAGTVAAVAVVKVPKPRARIPWYRRWAPILTHLRPLAGMVGDAHWGQILRIGLKMRPPAALSKPYYTLEVIGVAPDVQGQGIGGRLLEHIHAQCDQDTEATGIYLYTGDEPNTMFYARRGYEVLKIKKAGPLMIWFMFRARGI